MRLQWDALISPKCHTYTLYPYEAPQCREQRRNSHNRTTTKTTFTWNRYQFSALIRQLIVWIANEFEFINYSTFYPTFILCTYLHGLQCSTIHSIELELARIQLNFCFFGFHQKRNEWKRMKKQKEMKKCTKHQPNENLHPAFDCLIWHVFMESTKAIQIHASVHANYTLSIHTYIKYRLA